MQLNTLETPVQPQQPETPNDPEPAGVRWYTSGFV